ncbi:uncharacterized protein LOC110836125 [Zootermopsis nevadensis]|uniref:uncharacterized protein LOC110836125 n=1 Tax=Zootermopsis nevadensis TaxID=136037 RepID=UPI000B8EA00B|nr:uncharacterized protein LOC110836125 [Zootermopsis nevadensis]
MAIVLKNAEFVFAADEEECLRQAVDILMDELFGVNVEVYDKLTVSALETYVMNRILSLPRWLAEKEAYYFLYDKISKGEECKMLTGVSLPQTSTSTSALVVDSVDYLGFTKQEKETVFKRARSLMDVALKAIKKHVSAASFLKHFCDHWQ